MHISFQILISCCTKSLNFANQHLDHEDLIEKTIDGLDDDYKTILDIINGHNTPISFDELHEKLIMKELSFSQVVIEINLHS